MDFQEIMAYKPNLEFEEPGKDEVRGKRKRAVADEGAEDMPKRPLTDADRLRMLMEMGDVPEDMETFDETALKRLCVALERKATRNQEMRMKHPSDPTKFVDSEVDLHGEIQAFHVAATAPKYFPVMVKLGTVSTLLSLLIHENADVCLAVVGLLQELTDGDVIEDDEIAARQLIDALLDGDFVSLVVSLLERLKEPDDAQGIHQLLGR